MFVFVIVLQICVNVNIHVMGVLVLLMSNETVTADGGHHDANQGCES